MWIASKFGFYSIVKDSKSENFVVRARIEKDLKSIVNEVSVLRSRRIIFTLDTDYAYRIFVSKEELQILMTYLTLNIDYTNFKDSIKKSKSQKDKSVWYLRIWNIMFQYQIENELSLKKKKFIFNEYY